MAWVTELKPDEYLLVGNLYVRLSPDNKIVITGIGSVSKFNKRGEVTTTKRITQESSK